MSLEIIKSQISKFLSSDEPEVMAIRGAWGAGKTFAWKKLLLEAKDKDDIALEKYSYVSLFGINSLENLKFSIFQHVVSRELIGIEPSLETLKSNALGLMTSFGKKSFNLFSGVQLVQNFSPAIESLSFLTLKNTLICVDDFERKGKHLQAQDVMGLISSLKEQKNCKIVLILNEESLREKESSDYKRYREKVIDIELKFDPSATECASIALDHDDVSLKIAEHIKSLDIKNIRIISKIDQLSKKLLPLLKNFEDEVVDQALHTLSLLVYCFYSDGEEVPSFDFALKSDHILFDFDEESKSDEEKKWKAFLRSYNYYNTDEFDLEVAKLVENGYVDELSLTSVANRHNDQIISSKSTNSFSSAWDSYHNTFEDNQGQVVERLYASFKENAKHISIVNLDGTVRLLRDLGEGHLADEIIEHYIEANCEKKEQFNLSGNPFAGDIRDSDVIRRLNEEFSASKKEKSLKEVVTQIAERNNWGQNDVKILLSATTDDFYALFKEEKGPHLSHFVDACLQFGRFGDAEGDYKKIGKTAEEALIKIGKESTLNARRISKFGITVK